MSCAPAAASTAPEAVPGRRLLHLYQQRRQRPQAGVQRRGRHMCARSSSGWGVKQLPGGRASAAAVGARRLHGEADPTSRLPACQWQLLPASGGEGGVRRRRAFRFRATTAAAARPTPRCTGPPRASATCAAWRSAVGPQHRQARLKWLHRRRQDRLHRVVITDRKSSVEHVEVFQMGGVRTCIIGRPPPSPRHRRAHTYTLRCEKPYNPDPATTAATAVTPPAQGAAS